MKTAKKPFRKWFPWLRLCKLSVILLFFIVISAIIFFSVEECLQDEVDEPEVDAARLSKCVLKMRQLNSKNKQDQNETILNKTLTNQILRCGGLVLSRLPKEKHCQFNFRHIMNWGYFTIVSLFGIGKTTKHLNGVWSQLFHIVFLLLGLTLTVRLYQWFGIIGINLLNILLKGFKEKLGIKWKPRQSYQIFILSLLLLILYAIICALITVEFSEKGGFKFSIVYQWIMILFSVSDEFLLKNAFSEEPTHLLIPAILIIVGYIFTSILIASLINIRYRLTHHLVKKVKKNHDGKLQGCFV